MGDTGNASRNIPNTMCGLVGTFLISAKMILIPCVLWGTECFGAQEVDIFFLNNIFNLKGSCVLRTLKNGFAIF